MADIVRMGRSNKGSQTSTETSYASHDAASHYRTMNQNHSGQCVFHDEWPVDEKPNVSFISNAFIASDADVISDVSNLHDSKLLANDDSEAVQMSEGDSGNNNSDNIGSDFISSRHTIVNNDGRALYSNNDLKDSCYDSHRCAYVQDEANGAQLSHSNHLEHLTGNAVVDVSSADGNFDQLSLRNSNLEVPQTEDNLTVVLPDHLQALAADCSHLSFGTYNSGSNPASSVPPATNPFRNDLDETERALDHSSGFLDASNSVYRGDEQLGSMYDTVRREISGDKNYDFLASSKLDMLKQIIPEATLEHEYITSSVPDTSFERIQWPAPTVPFLRSEWESRNLPTFPSETVAGSDFVHVGILASKMKALRDSDFLQSSSVIKQSLPSRYSNSVSTTSNPTISMPEVIRPGTYSLPQRSSALNQHLRVQPTLPCEQSSISAAMGYLSLSQNHAYKPSGTLQQAYSDTSAYDQSLAGMKYGLPMNRSEVSMNRLPLSAKESSVYGNFGTPTYSPGNFLHSSTAPTIASNGYDEALHTQYRVGSSFSSSQQNRGFPIMDYGPGSRTLPSVPESTYYSLLGQSQGHIEYQRGQLQSNYGVPIYPDLHHSQTAMAAEHQLQSGPQDHSSKQSHHLWHRSY
ncbi:GBF-interacting protein 1-like [Quillaja saponaria]|uniref:GBF-interacting protein 1-like n=1 Tax=Quillaja saponaria TaxID=32244 RepID=A0AAD7LVI0_QUISA|nr:GBF-interacting protein 1-like [Quillaja saponaria]